MLKTLANTPGSLSLSGVQNITRSESVISTCSMHPLQGWKVPCQSSYPTKRHMFELVRLRRTTSTRRWL